MLHSPITPPPHDFQVDNETSASSSRRAISFSSTESEIRSLVLKVVNEKGMACIPDVMQQHPGGSRQQVAQVLSKMAKSGEMKRAAHGIYVRPDSKMPCEAEIKAIRLQHSKPRRRRDATLLEYLKDAHSSVDIQKRFSISRQRVDQKTKSLMSEGSLHRLRFGGAWHYATSMNALRSAAKRRQGSLEGVEIRILNALPSSGLVDGASLSAHLEISWNGLKGRLPELVTKGLIEMRMISGSPFVEITPKGRRHANRLPSVEHMAATDFRKRFGAARTDILKIVDTLGPLQAQEIRYCLEALDPEHADLQIPQTLSRMRSHGLLAEVDVEGSARCAHVLGPDSSSVMDWIRIHSPALKEERLTKAIAQGYARTYRLRRKMSPASTLSPRQVAVLKTLQATGNSFHTRDQLLHDCEGITPAELQRTLVQLHKRGLSEKKMASQKTCWRLSHGGQRALKTHT